MARTERTYLDFDVEIAPGEGGMLQAKVVDSPAGQAECAFAMPIDQLELENFVLRVGRTRSGRRRVGSPQYRLAREVGTKLYEAMFDGEVRIAFRRSIDRANDVGAGLRIRLRFDDAPQLAQVPWEYLFSPGVGDFLVLSAHTPVVRHLDLPMSDDALAVDPPLKVLVVVASPKDLEQLDGEREVELVRRAVSDLAARGSVVVETLVGATLQELRRTLRRGEFHVLHFIGHGGYDEQHDDGVLAFEDDDGRSRHISGAQLGTILHDHRTLRLVVLNACEGARTSSDDPFSGVAQSLLRRGVPAVVAMQFEITDEAAIAFSHELYLALVEGEPVESAVAEARLEIFSSDNDIEWGTPVLYSRARDGRLFDVAEHVAADAPPVRKRTELPPPPPRSGAATGPGAATGAGAARAGAGAAPSDELAGEVADVVAARIDELDATAVPSDAGAGGVAAAAVPAATVPAPSPGGDAPEDLTVELDLTEAPVVAEPTARQQQTAPVAGQATASTTPLSQPGPGAAPTSPLGDLGPRAADRTSPTAAPAADAAPTTRVPRPPVPTGPGSGGTDTPAPVGFVGGAGTGSGGPPPPTPTPTPSRRGGRFGWLAVGAVATFVVLGIIGAMMGDDTEPGADPTDIASPSDVEGDQPGDGRTDEPGDGPTEDPGDDGVTTTADFVAVRLSATGNDPIIDELDLLAPVVIADDVVFGDPDSRLAAEFRVGWDDDRLWVLADVFDDQIQSPFVDDPPRLFRGDGIGFEVGADPRAMDPDELLRPGDRHVLAGVVVEGGEVVDGDGVAAVNVPNANGVFAAAPDAAAGMVVDAFLVDDGRYAILVGVPWSIIGVDPGPGVVLGLNLNASDVIVDALRTMVSTNPDRTIEGQRHPGRWNTIELRG